MWEGAVKRTSQECSTLREYREQVLRLPQTEVARRAKKTQAWISMVERTGHLPRPWNREPLLKAYELMDSEEELVRLIENTARTAALRRPAAADVPLFAQPNIDNKTDGKMAWLYPEAAVLGQTEIDRMQQRIRRIWRQA